MDGFIIPRRMTTFAGLCFGLILWPTITFSNPFPQDSNVIDLNDGSVGNLGNLGNLGSLLLQDSTAISINDIVETTEDPAETADDEAEPSIQLVPSLPSIGCTSDASIDDVFDGDTPEDFSAVYRRGQVCPISPPKPIIKPKQPGLTSEGGSGKPKPKPALKQNSSRCKDTPRTHLLSCGGPEIITPPKDEHYCDSVVNCVEGKFSQVRPCALT